MPHPTQHRAWPPRRCRVRHRARRQPRRDRLPRDPHAAAHGDPLGRRLLRRRRRRAARARWPTSPSGIGTATCAIPVVAVIVAAAGHRRAGRAPRLRLPLRERRVRRRLRGGRDRLRRAAGVGDRGDGRQDPRQADGGGGGRARWCPARTGRASTTPRSRWPSSRSATRCCSSRRAGGGGKGMREVHRRRRPRRRHRVAPAARPAARSATTPCSSSAWSPTPRHIEIQVLADTHGNVIHLGERECSLQRRHQKIIEEAPSPLLTDGAAGGDGRRRRARRRARCGYTGAGTVEFIVDGRRPRPVLLHGDEHPAAGRAPGHRGGHRRSTSSSCSCGWRRASRCRGGRTPSAARARRRGADLRRGPGERASCPPAGGSCGCASRRTGRPGRLRARRGRGRGQRLRPDARQGDRVRPRPRRGAAPAGRRARRHRAARARHQRRRSCARCWPTRTCAPGASTPGSSAAASTR